MSQITHMLESRPHVNIAVSLSLLFCVLQSAAKMSPFTDKKCSGGSDSDDGENEKGNSSGNRHPRHSTMPSSSKHNSQDMASVDSKPIFLPMPEPTHPSSAVRSQPLPTEEMTLSFPSRTSPSNSPRASTHTYASADRYRPQHQSSLAFKSYTSDFAPGGQTGHSHHQPRLSTKPSRKQKSTDAPHPPPLPQTQSDNQNQDSSHSREEADITLEHREPHEVTQTAHRYLHPIGVP